MPRRDPPRPPRRRRSTPRVGANSRSASSRSSEDLADAGLQAPDLGLARFDPGRLRRDLTGEFGQAFAAVGSRADEGREALLLSGIPAFGLGARGDGGR
jgi:hypothetical protein